MKNPDFIKIAEGYGIQARRVENRDQLDQAINEMLNAKESHLLEVIVEKQGNVFPMIPAGAAVDEVRLS